MLNENYFPKVKTKRYFFNSHNQFMSSRYSVIRHISPYFVIRFSRLITIFSVIIQLWEKVLHHEASHENYIILIIRKCVRQLIELHLCCVVLCADTKTWLCYHISSSQNFIKGDTLWKIFKTVSLSQTTLSNYDYFSKIQFWLFWKCFCHGSLLYCLYY